jgi:hypothetical protein
MSKEERSKFSFFRASGWKLLILSLIIVGASAYLLKDIFLPYHFNVLENVREDVNEFRTYHDFNGDGLSETIEVKNLGPNKNLVYVKSWNGGYIDQANYWEPIDVGGFMFTDVTGDAYHELIAFTQKGDSSYLYVHDIISKQPVIRRHFLFCAEEPLTPHHRQIDVLPACAADNTVYQHKVIIFEARSYNALRPRSVYAFDLDTRSMIHQFETRSALGPIFPIDLTGDGVDEIVVGGLAYGNVHYPTQYSDDRCWLFVLDQRLNPIFPPLSFAEYPSEFFCAPVEDHSEKYILAAPHYVGERNLYDYLYLINAQGKIHVRTKNPYTGSPESGPVVSHRKNPTEIYGVKGDNQLIKLSQKLETVLEVTTPFDKIRALTAKDLNADGREELLCVSETYFLIYDDDLKLLTKLPIPNPGIRTSFREMGKGQPMEIGLSVGG